MDAVRRVMSVVNRRRKIVWKSVKKNCIFSCFKFGRRSKSPNTTSTHEASDEAESIMSDETSAVQTTVLDIIEEIIQICETVDSAKEPNELVVGDAVEAQPQNDGEHNGKKRRNVESQEATQCLIEERDGNECAKIDETKPLNPSSPNNSLKKTSITKSNIDEQNTTNKKIDTSSNMDASLNSAKTSQAIELKDEAVATSRAVVAPNNMANTLKTAETSVNSRSQQDDCKPNETPKANQLPYSINNYATRQPGRAYIRAYVNVHGKRIIHMDLAKDDEIELNKIEKAWVPTIATKQTVTNLDEDPIEKLIKEVRSILNKIAPENVDVLIKSFLVLQINTMQRLENVVDLVFEKAIEERVFASRYAVLCSALQSVQVTCAESNRTTSFKRLLVKKCQSMFESIIQSNSVKKSEEIDSCTDPEKKKELQIEFKEKEQSLRRRFIGNCCFIGELYNERIITLNIMQYSIANLMTKRSEASLECLCNLLKVSGKKLERSCDMKSTFSTINDLLSVKSISMRMRFMMRDVLDMRENNWSPKTLDGKTEVTGKEETNNDDDSQNHHCVANVTVTEQRGQTQKKSVSKTSKANKKMKSSVVKEELDPSEMDDRFRKMCSTVIEEYEQLHNLDDVIYLLVEDENSVIRTKHQDFVTATSLMTLDSSPNSRTEAGKLFAELLTKNVLTMTDITRGIDTVLKEWNDYLMDYPHFFSYVAAIVAPLLISNTASFGFNNLKYACSSIRQNNCSAFFAEILRTIIRSENAMNVENDAAHEYGSVLRTYDMWRGQTKQVPLDVFIPDSQINTYIKNDQLGVLLLAMSIHKTSVMVEGNKSLYSAIHKWIKKHIDVETVRDAEFVRSLTVAMAVVCSNNQDPKADFFDRDRSRLIKNFVLSECDFTPAEIQERTAQCILGCRDISAWLQVKQTSAGDVDFWKSKLLHELCSVGAINDNSITSCTA